MDPIIGGMLIGLAAGAGKTMLFDEPQRRADAQLAAQTTALSPWTGLKGEMPRNKAGENLFSGAMTGAQMGQSYGIAQANKGLLDAQTKLLAERQATTAPAATNTSPRITNQSQLNTAYSDINRAIPGANVGGGYTPMQYQSIGAPANPWTGFTELGPTTVRPYPY